MSAGRRFHRNYRGGYGEHDAPTSSATCLTVSRSGISSPSPSGLVTTNGSVIPLSPYTHSSPSALSSFPSSNRLNAPSPANPSTIWPDASRAAIVLIQRSTDAGR